MAKLSETKTRAKTPQLNQSAHTLLGRWLNWAITNGHVYKDDGLSEETAGFLFVNNPPKKLARVKELRKLLSDAAG